MYCFVFVVCRISLVLLATFSLLVSWHPSSPVSQTVFVCLNGCKCARVWLGYRLLLPSLSLTKLISSLEDGWDQRDHNMLSVFITHIIWQLLVMGGWVVDGCVRLLVSGVRCVYLPSKCSVVDWVTLHPCGGGVYYRLMWQHPPCSSQPSHLSTGNFKLNIKKIL